MTFLPEGLFIARSFVVWAVLISRRLRVEKSNSFEVEPQPSIRARPLDRRQPSMVSSPGANPPATACEAIVEGFVASQRDRLRPDGDDAARLAGKTGAPRAQGGGQHDAGGCANGSPAVAGFHHLAAEEIRFADKIGNIAIGRRVIELARAG